MQNLALLVLKPDFWRINWFRRETSFGEENGVPQSCCKDETQCQSDQVLWDRENSTIVQVCLLDLLLFRCSMFIFLVINLCLLQTCWPHRLGAFICLVSPPTICLWFSPPLPQFLLSRFLSYHPHLYLLVHMAIFFVTVAGGWLLPCLLPGERKQGRRLGAILSHFFSARRSFEELNDFFWKLCSISNTDQLTCWFSSWH